jgi:hypothetical protein
MPIRQQQSEQLPQAEFRVFELRWLRDPFDSLLGEPHEPALPHAGGGGGHERGPEMGAGGGGGGGGSGHSFDAVQLVKITRKTGYRG